MDEAGPTAPSEKRATDPALAEALARLTAAIDGLERAARRQRARLDSSAGALAELDLMRTDRQKLADALDAALARNTALEVLCDQLGGRIDRVIGEVRAVLSERS